jgi:hypothetical protein
MVRQAHHEREEFDGLTTNGRNSSSVILNPLIRHDELFIFPARDEALTVSARSNLITRFRSW